MVGRLTRALRSDAESGIVRLDLAALDHVWGIDHNSNAMPAVVEGDFEWDSTKAESNPL